MTKKRRLLAGLLTSILLLTGISICGCQRNSTKLGVLDILEGNWAWVYSQGGYGGQYIYPDSVGYDKIINIGSNSIYIEIVDDSVSFRGRYEIVRQQISGELAYVMIIENYPKQLIIDRLDADTLVLGENCDDCFEHTYIRLYPI